MLPVLLYFYYIHFRGYSEIAFWHYYINIYFGLGEQPIGWSGPSWPDMNFGHLWFLEHLLLYVSIYSIFRLLNISPVIKRDTTGFPKPYTIILFIIFLSIITFVVRVWYPTDHWSGFLFIIQTEYAHVPQYVTMFILGIIAYRRNWLTNLQIMNHSNNLSKILSQSAYSVYIIHVPVVVALQYSLQAMPLSAVLKFVITIIGGVTFSFLLSYLLIRKIPYLQRIL